MFYSVVTHFEHFKCIDLMKFLLLHGIFIGLQFYIYYSQKKLWKIAYLEEYLMKPKCSAIKEKIFCVLSVIDLFTAKYKPQREYPLSVLIP